MTSIGAVISKTRTSTMKNGNPDPQTSPYDNGDNRHPFDRFKRWQCWGSSNQDSISILESMSYDISSFGFSEYERGWCLLVDLCKTRNENHGKSSRNWNHLWIFGWNEKCYFAIVFCSNRVYVRMNEFSMYSNLVHNKIILKIMFRTCWLYLF